MKILMGVDPEFYVVNRETNKPVSAHELVPGTKKDPSRLPSGGYVQSDGVAVEFNIPASPTAMEFSDNITGALNDLRALIPSKYKVVFKPITTFDKKYFDELPENVKELGCDPDMNAYTGTFNRSPGKEVGDRPVRVFGGHIHIGWGKNMSGDAHLKDCITVIKQIETMGIPDYTHSLDVAQLQAQRQTMYGSRGSFRAKPYGVEWRAPSNVWLGYGPQSWTRIFDTITAAIHNMKYGRSAAYRNISGYHIPGRATGTYTT